MSIAPPNNGLSASSPLRFGLVGSGMVSDAHARSLQECDAAELAMVYSRTEARAKAFGEKHTVTWTTDLDRALGCPELDAVILTTPPYKHASQAIAAMRAGKHVLVEKPMAVSSAECDEMMLIAEQTERRLGVVFQSRFKKPVQRVRSFIQEGRLGKLLHICGYVKWYRPQEYYESTDWRGRLEREGGGVIFSQAGHTLDLMQWICGPVEWVFTNMVTAPVHQGIEIENLATVSLRFANGAIGTLEAATALYPGTPERLEFYGTRGAIVLEAGNIVSWDIQEATPDDEPGDVQEKSGTGASDPMAFPITWHKRQIIDFIGAIRENRPPLVDGQEGRRLNDLCEVIYRSAREGSVVKSL